MSKTPEELAKEYCNQFSWNDPREEDAHDAFLAGYQAAQQWISVKDRLPALYEVVLVLLLGPWLRLASLKLEKNEAADIGEYKVWREIDQYRLKDSDTGCFAWNDITHWMPLPAAPKEEV